MSTLSERKFAQAPAARESSWVARLGRKMGWGLLTMVGALVALVALLPVAALPFITAVPLTVTGVLALVDVGLLWLLIARTETVAAKTMVIVGLLLVSATAVVASQRYATTPPIVGADGRPLPGSVAELTTVELNGREQWITIRGEDTDKPVLLFLAGGPGGSQLAATRKVLGELEKHFVVVNWDQPGAGKSYRAADFDTITPQQYVADAHQLTLYLTERFGKEKIYVMGESWGSILGVWMVQERPDLYHAMVGVAQMVAFLETDTYDYNLALEIAADNGDTDTVAALEAQGPPPYYGEGTAWKVTRYIMVLSNHMNNNPAIGGPGYDTFGDIAAVEYGLYDKVNYVRGLLQVMDALWPQLWEMDMREQVTRLEVPIYFLEGRHDVNAPPHLVEEYMQILDAPHKELIWMEHSGHSPWVDESGKVVDVMVNQVLPQTTP